MLIKRGLHLLSFLTPLAQCVPQGPSSQASWVRAPLTNPSYWGRYKYQVWCRLPCTDKIRSGELTVTISLSEPSRNINTYSSMVILQTNSTSYTVQNRWDLWPTVGLCSFQFHVQYDSGNYLSGYCTAHPHKLPTNSSVLQTKEGATKLIYRNSFPDSRGGFIYQALCPLPCRSGYFPEELFVSIQLDRPSTKFTGYSNMASVSQTVTPLSSTWGVVNRKHIDRQADDLCPFEFAVNYPSNPIPSGTCIEVTGREKLSLMIASIV